MSRCPKQSLGMFPRRIRNECSVYMGPWGHGAHGELRLPNSLNPGRLRPSDSLTLLRELHPSSSPINTEPSCDTKHSKPSAIPNRPTECSQFLYPPHTHKIRGARGGGIGGGHLVTGVCRREALPLDSHGAGGVSGGHLSSQCSYDCFSVWSRVGVAKATASIFRLGAVRERPGIAKVSIFNSKLLENPRC